MTMIVRDEEWRVIEIFECLLLALLAPAEVSIFARDRRRHCKPCFWARHPHSLRHPEGSHSQYLLSVSVSGLVLEILILRLWHHLNLLCVEALF